MRFKKITGVLASLLTLSVVLTSCGGSTGAGKSYKDDNGNTIYRYNFNMYIQDDNEYSTDPNSWFDNYIRDKFHIEFNYDRIPRTDWEKKTNTYFGSGNMPDLTIGGKEYNYKNWANQGFLEPIPYEKLDNWKKLWSEEDFKDVIANATSSDGKLYYLPSVRQEKVQMAWLYREDVFKELGLEFPETIDDFYNVCKAIKAAYPNSIIISANGQKTSSLTGFFQAYWIPELVLQWHSYVDPVTGEFVPYALTTDNAREMYKTISKFYQEGLIDREILTMEKESFYQRLSTNNAFITYNYVYNTNLFDQKSNASGAVNNSGGQAKWTWSGNMLTAFPDKGVIYKKDPLYSNWGPAFTTNINSEEGKFDAILDFFDWCASEEGQMLLTYGIEGETYDMVDGKPVLRDEWYHETKNTSGKKLTKEYGTLSPQFLKEKNMFDEVRGNVIEPLWEAYSSKPNYYYFKQFPMKYTEEEEQKFTDLEIALNNKRDEYMTKFFSGQADPAKDSDWNQYISDMNQMGLQDFINLQTTVYERTKAEYGD